MVNKRKVLEAARKLAQKGAKDKALAEYQKLLKLDPKDAKLRLEIGDAHRRWGQVDQAIETYTRVAEQYMGEGFDARAVAVFKQILNLAPDRFDAYAPLAELYERMGLGAEAISALQTAADGYHRLGKKSEALGLLRKMANADPSNTRVRIKVADLLRQEGKKQDAVSEYQLAAEELERQGDAEAVSGVYRRILELDATNVRALGTLAQNLAARGKVGEAIPLAERALQLDDGNAERYEQLAALFERANRGSDRESVLRRLADLYRNRGDGDRAQEIVQQFAVAGELSGAEADQPDELASNGLLEDDPDALFGDQFPDSDGAPELSIDFGSDIDIDPGSTRSGATMQPLRDSQHGAQSGTRAGAGSSDLSLDGSLADEIPRLEVAAAKPASAVDLEQLLAEASVYLRYGKRDKAIAHLQQVIDAEPEHRAALEKLGEAHAENGENEQAVAVWMRAAKRAHDAGDSDALRVLRGRIAVLDESAAASLAVAPREASPPPDAGGDDDPDLASADSLDAGDDLGDLVLDDDDDLLDDLPLPEAKRAAEPERRSAAPSPEIARGASRPKEKAALGSTDDSNLSASAKQQVLDDLEEADFYIQQGLHDEAEGIYRRVLSVAPNHARALLRLGEIAAARGDAPGRRIAAIDADHTPVPDIDLDDENARFERDGDASEPDEVEISLEFSDEGLDDPAPLAPPAAIEDLSDLDLGDEDADSGEASGDGSDTQEIRAGADAGSGATTAPVGATGPGESDGGFDLAAALSDAFDDDPASSSGSAAASSDDGFAAVFQAFKKGVRETLSEGDHQAHYDLAIAYKEMGLLDDAIHELRTTMADPGRTAECLHLIGLCAIDADQAPLAIEHLEQLLMLPGLDPDAALAGRFDLGRALESVGDLDGARREWEAVAAVKPAFQDVSKRLAGLGEPKSESSDDGGLESFDDVMDDVADEEAGEVVVGGETFDDLVAEANTGDVMTTWDEPEIEAEPLFEAEAVIEAEPVPVEPEPAPPRAGPPPAPRLKKKKVSFL